MAKMNANYEAFGLFAGDVVKVVRRDLFVAVIELPSWVVSKCICVPVKCLDMLES